MAVSTMEKKKKITLIIVLASLLVLVGYLIYPNTATAFLNGEEDGFNILTPDKIGKTVEESGVVVTVKLPRAVKINENITVNYTITNKRQETINPNTYNNINHTENTLMPPLYFEPVHPGQTITFTDSYPIRAAYDGVIRGDGEPYENTITRVFHPFYVQMIALYFGDGNNNPSNIAMEDLGCVTYNSVWGFRMDLKGAGITSMV